MKKNVRIVSMILIVVMTLSVLALVGCKKDEEAPPTDTAEAAGEIEMEQETRLVAMATDVGGLGDKSFNDGSWEGLQRAEDELENVEARVVESSQMTDYVPNLSGLAEDGAEIVFAVGFLMAEAMVEAAEMNPQTYFAGIDIGLDPETAPDNALGILFREQEAGFLAGVVAGLLTKEYADVSDKLNDDNVVGMVLGMDIPPVERYQAGFYAGVKSVNPECEVLSVVTGVFDDQAKGKEAAIAMIDQGADIIFQVAGLTGVGSINAAKEAGVAAMGVDVDQNAVAPETVITSAEKKLANATFMAIKDALEGTFQGGQNVNLGINENAIGIAPFHDWDDVIPQAVKDAVEEAKEAIQSGDQDVPATRAEAGYEG
ncbi:MAG: BMP family lipoprotein [Spirochaetota bacterium]